jgi:uncharacterized protein (TIGR01244 family)
MSLNMNTRKLDEQITVGAQPTEADVADLARQGFRSVVNLRRDREDDQPLSPAAEGEIASRCGLQYVHIPVSLSELQAEQLERFQTEMESLPAPFYIHCRGGSRAGLLAIVRNAVEAGDTGEEVVRKLSEAGFLGDSPELRSFIQQYVDSQFEAGD